MLPCFRYLSHGLLLPRIHLHKITATLSTTASNPTYSLHSQFSLRPQFFQRLEKTRISPDNISFQNSMSLPRPFCQKVNKPVADDSNSSAPKPTEPPHKPEDDGHPVDESQLTLFQRFKRAYKTHGWVFIAFHGVSSAVIFSSLCLIVYSGVDIVGLLKWLHAPEKMIDVVGKPGVGAVAGAYVLYKIITPLRYGITLFGTNYTVKLLRRWNWIAPIREEDRLRNLSKEVSKKQIESLKDKVKDQKEASKRRIESIREQVAEHKKKRKDK